MSDTQTWVLRYKFNCPSCGPVGVDLPGLSHRMEGSLEEMQATAESLVQGFIKEGGLKTYHHCNEYQYRIVELCGVDIMKEGKK